MLDIQLLFSWKLSENEVYSRNVRILPKLFPEFLSILANDKKRILLLYLSKCYFSNLHWRLCEWAQILKLSLFILKFAVCLDSAPTPGWALYNHYSTWLERKGTKWSKYCFRQMNDPKPFIVGFNHSGAFKWSDLSNFICQHIFKYNFLNS